MTRQNQISLITCAYYGFNFSGDYSPNLADQPGEKRKGEIYQLLSLTNSLRFKLQVQPS